MNTVHTEETHPPGWWTRLGTNEEKKEGQSTPDRPETAGGGC